MQKIVLYKLFSVYSKCFYSIWLLLLPFKLKSKARFYRNYYHNLYVVDHKHIHPETNFHLFYNLYYQI